MKVYQKLLAIPIIGLCFAIIAGGAIYSPARRATAASALQTWAQSGFNRQHTSYNPFETTINTSNVAQLNVAWSMSVSGNPVERNGLLYVSTSSALYAVNVLTGNTAWASPGRGSFDMTPAIDTNGILYSGTWGGTLYALRASTGALVWANTVGAIFDTSPLWASGIVYIGASNGRLYAMSDTAGKVLWSFHTNGEVSTAPSIDNNGVVYVDDGATLYALNARTGKLLWKYTTTGSPVLANGLVYIGNNGSVIALNETSGKRVWTYAVPDGAGVSSVAVANGVVFFSDRNDTLHAVNAMSGKQIWAFADGSEQVNNTSSTPVVANGVVYSGGYISNEISFEAAVNEATGALLWTNEDTSSSSACSFIVVNGMLFVNDGTLWAYHL
jgi:outer membrane protein assembly factor BamB